MFLIAKDTGYQRAKDACERNAGVFMAVLRDEIKQCQFKKSKLKRVLNYIIGLRKGQHLEQKDLLRP